MSDAPVGQDQNDRAPSPSIIMRGEVMSRIEADMWARTDVEAGGVLVGNAAPSSNLVLVMGHVAARDASPGQRFTFSAESLRALANEAARVFPGQRVVGWYHSAPNRGVYMSTADVATHSTAFSQAWHVGFVFDPVQNTGGFFGWAGNEIARIPHWEVTGTVAGAGSDLPVVLFDPEAPLTEADEAAFEPAVEDAPPPAPFSPAGESAAAMPDDVSMPNASFSAPSAEPASDAPARGAAIPPVTPTDIGPVVGATTVGGLVPGPAPEKKSGMVKWVVLALVAVLIVIIGVVAFGGSDDKSASTTTTVADSVVVTDPASSSSVDESVASVPVTEAPTSSSDATTENSAATPDSGETAPTVTFPSTPTTVQTPLARVGAGAVPCAPTTGTTYQPTADCFVPLNNGNIIAFSSGSLLCVDPSGKELVADVTSFQVGVPTDPAAIIANGNLAPTCVDLSYTSNVLSGGAGVLDGLCGSSGTQINEATRRCFSANSTTGAVAAVVRGATERTTLAALCAPTAGDSAAIPLTWSNTDVSTLWKIDSLLFDSSTGQFTANASRNGTKATASFSCV